VSPRTVYGPYSDSRLGGPELKKILYIQASADWGGTEVSSFQLASHLDPNEFETGVLFHCTAGPVCEDYRKAGIPFWTVSFPRVLQALKIIRQFKPDIIQIYGLRTNVLWRPLLRLLGYRRLIGVNQGLTNQGEKPSRGRLVLDRMTHGWLQNYVVNSQQIAATLTEEGFDPTKLLMIYNGIPLNGFLKKSGTQNHPPVIVCVGNLRQVKGHTYLLDTFKILRARKVSFEAWIVGDGPLKSQLVSKTRDLQLESHVKFLGRVEAVKSVLQKADIFSSLPLSEGVPISMMEAMSCGLPIVASRVGGVPELVRDGTEGFLVPSKAVDSAAERLAVLLSDPGRRLKMGHAGRFRVESQFNLNTTVIEYENLYRNPAV